MSVEVSQCGLQPVTANSGLNLYHGLCHVALGFQDCDLFGINRICPLRLSSESSSVPARRNSHLPGTVGNCLGMIQLLVLRAQEGNEGPGSGESPAIK